MSRKPKRTNTITFEDGTKITFSELPYGYFYKGHFYTESQCFHALEMDGEATTHKFLNGTWEFRNYLFKSLEELYEDIGEETSIPLSKFKSCYELFGVVRDPRPRTMYSYTQDDNGILFDNKGEVLMKIRNETDLIETTEDREERYLDSKTKEECIEYFHKTKKERIKILEEME